nr:putative antimicrobial knottin protein Btk-2 [Bemisia tabaci]
MHKLFAFFVFALVAAFMIAGAQSNCLSDGAACQSDGSIGNCCSGFCLQYVEPGLHATPGTCTYKS